jgi:hypothetical protein
MEQSKFANWENLVRLAETEPDLKKTRAHLEEAETAMFLRAIELVNSRDEHEESEALHAAAERLLWVKRVRLGWPDPYFQEERQAS